MWRRRLRHEITTEGGRNMKMLLRALVLLGLGACAATARHAGPPGARPRSRRASIGPGRGPGRVLEQRHGLLPAHRPVRERRSHQRPRPRPGTGWCRAPELPGRRPCRIAPEDQRGLLRQPGRGRHLADSRSWSRSTGASTREPGRPTATTATGPATGPRWIRRWARRTTCVAVVDAAHRRGIRVLMDAVINHTGPVTPLDPAVARRLGAHQPPVYLPELRDHGRVHPGGQPPGRAHRT